MSRSEFLDILGRSLKGKIDDNEYVSQMEYYTSYFQDEMAVGRSEQEILDELGDPRLIAKTIVNTLGFRDDKMGRAYMHDTVSEDGKSYNDKNGGIHETKKSFFGRLKIYAIITLVVLFIILIIAALFRLFAFLLPVFFILIAVSIILAMFRRM